MPRVAFGAGIVIIAIWVVALLIVGLLALPTWAVATLMTSDGQWVTRIEPWLHRLPFGGWLEGWFPTWLDAAKAAIDALATVMAWLGGSAPILVWGLWAAAALLVVLLAALLSAIVVLVRRAAPPPAPPAPPAPA